ncbi:MAG TPA: choice-of-anchor K domain-containing protein [Trichormus sp. M33_DOE_039]|nr:choice-of-anchor K domain-containing protein [Trichormus sp. M33_DOE_039]
MAIDFSSVATKTTLTALASLALANSVQAAPPFTGNSSGTWGTPIPSTASIVYSGVGTDTFTWGDAASFGTGANYLNFVGNAFSTNFDTPFQIGNLTYFNGTTTIGTTPESVPLDVLLAFTDPSGLNENFNFSFNLISTDNNGTPDENADFVFPPNSFSSTNFNFGGQDYTLQLLGFSKDGGTTLVNEFRVRESETDTASLYAKITVTPRTTPEPSSIQALFSIAGLGVVVGLRKKLASSVKSIRGFNP